MKKFIKNFMEMEMENKEKHVCDYCGSDINVEYRTNPYNEEVNNSDEMEYICEVCYNESLDDI